MARKAKKPKTFYQTCLKRVLRDLGFKQPVEGMVFILAAVIYPKDSRKFFNTLKPQGMERSVGMDLITTIHDAREKYTVQRRDQLLRISEIRTLFRCFLNHASVEKLVSKSEDAMKQELIREAYTEYVKMTEE